MWRTSRVIGSLEDVKWSCGCAEQANRLVHDCQRWREDVNACHRLYWLTHHDSFA